nr:hypothetical protein [Pseudomonadota bacterium]
MWSHCCPQAFDPDVDGHLLPPPPHRPRGRTPGIQHLMLLLGLVAAGAVQAQVPALPPTEAPLPGEVPSPQLPAVTPEIIAIPPVPERGTEEMDSLVLEVKGFRLRGAQDHLRQGLRVSDLQALLEQRRQERQGRFGIFELEELADEITRYYRDKGFVVAKAFVPVQDVADGVVEITVLEGRLGSVTIEREAGRYREQRLLAPFAGQTGRTVHKDRLEGALLTLRDYPGLDATGVFRPGEATGDTDLVLRIEPERRFAGGLRLDNHGSQLSGEWRLRGDLIWNNPTNHADLLAVSLLHTFDPNNSLFGSVDYQLPVWRPGTLIGAGASRNDFDVGGEFRELDITGVSEIAEVYVAHNVIRSRPRNLTGRLGFSRKNANTEQNGMEFSQDTVAVLDLTVSGDFIDPFKGINLGFIRYSRGLGGVLDALDSDGDPSSSRQGGSGDFAGGDFDKVELSYTRLQSLPDVLFRNQSLLLRFFGQWSDDLLVSLEQLSIGGADSVRAYPRTEFLRDKGFFASLEWIVPAPGFADKTAFRNLRWGQVFQAPLFVDYARG